MSYADVERATGIRLGTVSKLESGAMNVTPKYFEQLAPAYGCSPRDFLPESDEPLSADEARLLGAVRARARSEALRALAACLGVPVAEVAVISSAPSFDLSEAAERLHVGARELLAAAAALRPTARPHTAQPRTMNPDDG